MSRKEDENWLVSAEVIDGGPPPTIEELDLPQWQGSDVMSHTPPDRRWTDELHKRGIRSMPYLNLCYQWADNDLAGWLPAEYPETVKIDRWGQKQVHQNYYRHDGKTVYEICASVRKARDLYLRQVEKTMACGADGLFLDNAWMWRRCWGEEHKVHKHEFYGDPRAEGAVGHRPFTYAKAAREYRLDIPVEDGEQIYAGATLIKEMRDLARSIQPDALVMANAGDSSGLPPLVWENIDAGMNELFMYAGFYHFGLPLESPYDNRPDDLFDWLSALEWTQQFTKTGKRVVCRPHSSPLDPMKKAHALYTFCVAKLYDAAVNLWVAPATGWLRRFRLGQALGEDPGSYGAVMYREYEYGVVAINPYGVAQEAWTPWQGKGDKAIRYGYCASADLPMGEVKTDGGHLRFKLAPDACSLFVPVS